MGFDDPLTSTQSSAIRPGNPRKEARLEKI
jgi:hypothetical protein